MPWESPTLTELISQRGVDLSNRLTNGAPLRPNSVLSVIARMQAAGEYNLYAFLAWGFLQCFPDKAETEFLEDWGKVWGVRRKAAVSATGKVRVQGAVGSEIMNRSIVLDTTGAAYIAEGITLEAETGEMTVTAETAGAAGNLPEGTTLNLASPSVGVESELKVLAPGLTGGVDEEDDESLRARIIKLIQSPPHGGNKADYEFWAMEISGVEKALCVPTMNGLGTVGLAVWGPPENPALDAETLNRVTEYVLEKCPVTAGPGLTVFVPDLYPVNFSLSITPDTPQIRENVRRELGDVFADEAAPGTTLPLSHLRAAVSLAAGEYDYKMTMPSDDVVPPENALAVLGELVFE